MISYNWKYVNGLNSYYKHYTIVTRVLQVVVDGVCFSASIRATARSPAAITNNIIRRQQNDDRIANARREAAAACKKCNRTAAVLCVIILLRKVSVGPTK